MLDCLVSKYEAGDFSKKEPPNTVKTFKLNASGTSKFPGATKVVNDQGKDVSLRKTLTYGTRYGIGVFCLTGEREEQIGWVPEKEQSLFDAIGMAYNSTNFRAKIHRRVSASCKNLGDKFTKITIAVICEIS